MGARKEMTPADRNIALTSFQEMGRAADLMKMLVIGQAPPDEKMCEWMEEAADNAYLEGKTMELAKTLKIPLPSTHLRGGAIRLTNGELLYLLDAIVSRAMELSAHVSQQPGAGFVGFPLKS